MRTCAWLLLAGLAGAPLFADDNADREVPLRQFFEGRSVTVRIDMPATSKGIDIRADQPGLLDARSLDDRMGETGVSIREGARVPVTRVHLKDDLIEFQLAGGGFNWLWDTQGKVSPKSGKSRRERDLEKEIHDESDPDRRHRLERELDEERRHREREERRSREYADAENRLRDQQDHQRALYKGSRFNLRWDHEVPPRAVTPRAVMEILSPWVDFSGFPGAPVPPRRSPRAADDRRDGDADLRTGMSWDDVQDQLGAPDHVDTSRDGDLRRTKAVYGGRGLELTFVNDVLVKIREIEAEAR
jgi:hypothetical protein